MITQTINLNLIPGGVLPRIKVSQYDKGSRVLQFNLFNGNSAFTIPVDASITIQGTKADHTGFQYSCTFSGSVVTADLEQQMTVFPGDVECEIRLSQNLGSVLLGTCNFILDVEEAALQNDIIISDTELPLVEKAAEAADAAEASALDAEAWAVGQRDGEDVPADDPAYHNNAKYYAETVPTLLTNYYTKSETYSKGEVDTALGGKQDTLTFDDSPTSASSNPVKSGGVYTALSGKVDTEAGKGLSKNDFTDAEKAKVDNAVLWSERKGFVGKNLLSVGNDMSDWIGLTNNATVLTTYPASDRVTATVNSSTNSITVTNYNTTGYWWAAREVFLEKNTEYILTQKSFTSTIKIVACNTGETSLTQVTWDADHKFNSGNYDRWFFAFYPSSFTCEEFLLRKTSILDSTFEPYLPSNKELGKIALNKNLTSDNDINDIRKPGFYTATTSPQNTPENRSYYSLIVIANNDTDLRQIIICGNALYTRYYGGSPSAWGPWTKYAGTTL